MPFFDAVFSAGLTVAEDLINEAKSLVGVIGPHIQDEETLKLICLMVSMTPPKIWTDKVLNTLRRLKNTKINLFNERIFKTFLNMIYALLFQPVEFLSPAQINIINLYEKYLVLIHRRYKWKRRPKPSITPKEAGGATGIKESGRRRKRKVSAQDDNDDLPNNKTRHTNTNNNNNSKRGNQNKL